MDVRGKIFIEKKIEKKNRDRGRPMRHWRGKGFDFVLTAVDWTPALENS